MQRAQKQAELAGEAQSQKIEELQMTVEILQDNLAEQMLQSPAPALGELLQTESGYSELVRLILDRQVLLPPEVLEQPQSQLPPMAALEADFAERLEAVILTIDRDNCEVSQTAQPSVKNLHELLQFMALKLKMKAHTDQPYVCLLGKRLFRTNCSERDDKSEFYCRLIAHAYHHKLLARAEAPAKALAGKQADYYTFLVDNVPKTLPWDDSLAERCPYAKSTVLPSNA